MPETRVVLYRITHQRYRNEPFSGKGGLRYSSRWASKGQLVSYAADHLATAALVKIAAAAGRADLLTQMIFVKAEVDAAQVKELPSGEWPEDWDQLPAPDSTRQVGDAWLEEGRHALLRVPSVVLPHAFNYVINTSRGRADALDIVDQAPLLLDNRVLSQLGAAWS